MAWLNRILWLRCRLLMRTYARRSQQETGELMGIIQETFSGIQVVKAFRAEQRELQRFFGSASRLLRLHLKRARVQEVTGPLMEWLGALGGQQRPGRTQHPCLVGHRHERRRPH